MRNTERRPRGIGDLWIRLIILVLAALLLIALQISGNLRPLQSAVTQLASPAQLSATGVTASVAGFFESLLQLRTLQQDAAELSARNAQLQAEINTLQEVETENEQLRGLLDFAQSRPRLELRGAQIVARVIGEESTNFLDSILIDLGRVHGVEVGMPVVTDRGLVGRISDVTDTASKILLLTDPSSSASALLGASRLNGVVSGSPGGELIMDFIPQGPTFEEGESVLTSGLGGRFPKGIVVGTVTRIDSQPNAVFQRAVVEPSVDFGSLELVLVITNFDPNEVLPDFDLLPAAIVTDTAVITGTGTVTATTAPPSAPTVTPAGETP
ncbi:MAG: rod shape-determining protein MreC [Caldilineaceae bacterium]|nr:rod shape-determining protein MreC [Caldilineaceae bacterium]MBP8291170.1 rod shape-determining protein MreC [Caldilineaceae bacterium]